MARRLGGERLDPHQPLPRGIPELHMRVGIGEIGMRLRQPCRLDDPHRAPDLMRLALILARQHRGRHQGRRQLDRLHHALARLIAIDLLQLQRARRQQHAALTPIGRLVDQPGRKIVVEDRQRAAPVAFGATIAEHRMRRPGRRRRKLQRLFARSSPRRPDRRRAGLRRTGRAGPTAGCPRARPWRGRRAARRRGRRRAAPIARAATAPADPARHDGARPRHGRGPHAESPWPIASRPCVMAWRPRA